jgi:hypothetical protein
MMNPGTTSVRASDLRAAGVFARRVSRRSLLSFRLRCDTESLTSQVAPPAAAGEGADMMPRGTRCGACGGYHDPASETAARKSTNKPAGEHASCPVATHQQALARGLRAQTQAGSTEAGVGTSDPAERS